LQKVDRIKALHESLLRVANNYTKPHYDYEPLLAESAYDFASSVSGRVQSLAAGLQATTGAAPAAAGQAGAPKDEIPRSLSHAFAKAAVQGSEGLSPEEPTAAALKRFATVHDRIGNARLKLVRFFFCIGDPNVFLECIEGVLKINSLLRTLKPPPNSFNPSKPP
jgi:hypothetical protein